VPYRATALLEHGSDTATALRPVARDHWSVYFRGSLSRGISLAVNGVNASSAGSLRPLVLNLTAGLRRARVLDEHFDTLPEMVHTNVDEILASTFCLVPEGDTTTSRRLFDALAAGCVPIVLARTKELAPNLPFPSSVAWRDIAVFGGSLECAAERLEDMSRWMRQLVIGVSSEACAGAVHPPVPCLREAVEAMRGRARAAFTNYLSYRHPGIVDALLAEPSTTTPCAGHFGPCE